MGRKYAGVVGSIAFAVVIARGVVHGASAEPTIKVACSCLFLFAAIGWVLGKLAERTIVESVYQRFNNELKASEGTQTEATAESAS